MEEQRFHRSLFVADLYADTLATDRDITNRTTGHVSLDRLREGNVALQAFTVFTVTPRPRPNGFVYEGDFNYAALLSFAQLRPPRLWFSPKERALDQACHLASLSAAVNGERSRPSLGSLSAPCANSVPVAEGAQVRLLLVRTAQDLANLVGRRASLLGDHQRRDNRAGTRRARHADIAYRVRFTCRPPQGHVVARNITDDDIRAVARTGGVIGVGFWPEAVCWTDAEDVTQQERLDAIVRAMAHIVTVLASPEFATEMHVRRPDYDPMDHIAFGSDFDGAVETPFDVGGMGLLTASMLRFRDANRQMVFDERAIRKIAGINVCRMLMTELPGGSAEQAQERGEPLMDGVAREQPRLGRGGETIPD